MRESLVIHVDDRGPIRAVVKVTFGELNRRRPLRKSEASVFDAADAFLAAQAMASVKEAN
jgi:hypothetical protein